MPDDTEEHDRHQAPLNEGHTPSRRNILLGSSALVAAATLTSGALAQAQNAAKKYWDPSRLQIVAVGDATKIRDILAKFGSVEVRPVAEM